MARQARDAGTKASLLVRPGAERGVAAYLALGLLPTLTLELRLVAASALRSQAPRRRQCSRAWGRRAARIRVARVLQLQ